MALFRYAAMLVTGLSCILSSGTGLIQSADAQGAATSDGMVPMFDENRFDDWVRTNTPESTWSLEDGLLVCSGKPIGEIRTRKMYQNFVMELEWRHMVPGGNAGIFVWADDITSRGVPFHRGIEVQVLENDYGNSRSHTTHGDIFPIHGATMTPENGRGGSRAFPTENRSNPSPQWNHYRIECVDGAISLAVNGEVVTRGRDCVPRKGYICLESEGGVVHYRNVRIRELPSAEVATDHVAIADRGYHSIYSGLNLDGWKASDIGEWATNDWVLSYSGPSDRPGKLESTESAVQTGFVVDVRLKEPASNARIEFGEQISVDLRDPSIQPQLEADGRWNRIEAWQTDGAPIIEVNGKRVTLEQTDGKKGTIVERQDGAGDNSPLTLIPAGAVEFCNLYLRSTNASKTDSSSD